MKISDLKNHFQAVLDFANNNKTVLIFFFILAMARKFFILGFDRLFGDSEEREKEAQNAKDDLDKITQGYTTSSGISIDGQLIQKDVNAIARSLGFEFNGFNFWNYFSEDEEAAMAVVKNYNSMTYSFLRDEYYRTYSRYLSTDLKRYLSSSEYDEIKYIIE